MSYDSRPPALIGLLLFERHIFYFFNSHLRAFRKQHQMLQVGIDWHKECALKMLLINPLPPSMPLGNIKIYFRGSFQFSIVTILKILLLLKT